MTEQVHARPGLVEILMCNGLDLNMLLVSTDCCNMNTKGYTIFVVTQRVTSYKISHKGKEKVCTSMINIHSNHVFIKCKVIQSNIWPKHEIINKIPFDKLANLISEAAHNPLLIKTFFFSWVLSCVIIAINKLCMFKKKGYTCTNKSCISSATMLQEHKTTSACLVQGTREFRQRPVSIKKSMITGPKRQQRHS